MEELKLKAAEDIKDDKAKQASEENEKAEGVEKSLKGQTSNASAEQDLDKFLLGDLEDSDGGGGILPCWHVVMLNSLNCNLEFPFICLWHVLVLH